MKKGNQVSVRQISMFRRALMADQKLQQYKGFSWSRCNESDILIGEVYLYRGEFYVKPQKASKIQIKEGVVELIDPDNKLIRSQSCADHKFFFQVQIEPTKPGIYQLVFAARFVETFIKSASSDIQSVKTDPKRKLEYVSHNPFTYQLRNNVQGGVLRNPLLFSLTVIHNIINRSKKESFMLREIIVESTHWNIETVGNLPQLLPISLSHGQKQTYALICRPKVQPAKQVGLIKIKYGSVGQQTIRLEMDYTRKSYGQVLAVGITSIECHKQVQLELQFNHFQKIPPESPFKLKIALKEAAHHQLKIMGCENSCIDPRRERIKLKVIGLQQGYFLVQGLQLSVEGNVIAFENRAMVRVQPNEIVTMVIK